MNDQTNQDIYGARFKRLSHQLLVLFLLSTLSLGSSVFVLQHYLSSLISEKEDISYVINISGRQRMLSQNISKTALLIMQDTLNPTRFNHLDSLNQLFRKSHQELKEANLNISSEDIDKAFDKLEVSLNNLLQVSEAVILKSRPSRLKPKLLEFEATFLPEMDAIVKEYELLGRDRFRTITTAVRRSIYLVIVLILFFGLLGYKVTSSIVRRYSIDLQQMANRLEDTKVELERTKLRERFAYVASHDLQEPIRTIISLAELLESKYKDDPDQESLEIVRFIHESSFRMSRQVSGLLDYSRLGKNQNLQKVDMGNILKDVLSDLKGQIELIQAKIQIAKMPHVIGYPIELRSAFLNFLGNALKFSKPSVIPEISISLVEDKHEWIFSIADNGIGIDSIHKEKIFQIFQRLNSRDAFEGFGIGLAHCQRVAELHRGRVWVESELGKGATFKFSISKSLK